MNTLALSSTLLKVGCEAGDDTPVQVTCHHASPNEFRERAAAALRQSWKHTHASSRSFPEQCLRRGVGPRFGMVDQSGHKRICWASSISHSASAEVVATALLTQSVESVRRFNRLTIGIDIESATRTVHPAVARLIAPRAVREADAVADGGVPLLAVICVKEAAYKADVRQRGRVLADYAWVASEQVGAAEWKGTVAAAQEQAPRFEVWVAYTAGRWLAVALGIP